MEKTTKKYPIGAENYTLYEEIGSGVSASVYRAFCITLNDIVAIKILDFERDNCDLNNVYREAQTMILVDHPNVLKSHCSFVSEHNLWVVMPYMAGGSCLHILKAVHPDGFEEVVIATILREVLKGLEYLHRHGHIHRDVKAGNILIHANGQIKLGDFGVSASLFDSGDRQRLRNTFTGTPCWMAPEIMEQSNGYDFKADIWSFAITAMELAYGHAPFSKYPPAKVFLMTLQNAPPGLDDYKRDKKFSRAFKQMIANCLVKDPSNRPSASKLLKNSFFKQARSNDYIVRTLLDGLPSLGDRLQELKRKEEAMLAQQKISFDQSEQKSQDQYKRGISDWNFDLDDLRSQAALIQDEDIVATVDQDNKGNASSPSQGGKFQQQFSFKSQSSDSFELGDYNQPALLISADLSYAKDVSAASSRQGSRSSSNCSIQNVSVQEVGKVEPEFNGKSLEKTNMDSNQSDKFHIQIPCQCICSSIGVDPNILSDKLPSSGASSSKAPINSYEPDEKEKGPVVQKKGRFKVTSESVDFQKLGSPLHKSQSMQVISQHPTVVSSPVMPTNVVTPPTNIPNHHSIYPQIHYLLQSNIIQGEYMLKVMEEQLAIRGQPVDVVGCMLTNTIASQKSLLESSTHDREEYLLCEIIDLQKKLLRSEKELQKYKIKHPPYPP